MLLFRPGKFTLQSARDFYNWAVSTDSNASYRYIDREEFEVLRINTESHKVLLFLVKETLKLHSVSAINEHTVMTRETTCCCIHCFIVNVSEATVESREQGFSW